jgi:putative ABC transport system permease protein
MSLVRTAETIAAEPASGSRGAALALRYALRELRSGLRGFYVFIACIALGVLAIAGVGSVAASLGDGLAREGRTLLGGDVAFSLIQREAKPDEPVMAASLWSSSRRWTAPTRCSAN